MGEFFRGMGMNRNIGIGGIGKVNKKGGGAKTFVSFHTSPLFKGILTISGQTLDSTSTPIAGCFVELELSRDGTRIATTISDGSGNYSFNVGNPDCYQVTAYKQGSPDIAGVTANTLIGT